MHFILIALLGIGACAQTPQKSIENSYRITNDKQLAPLVVSVIPNINKITVSISTSIKESSIIVNSENTECRGTIQISSDNFTTCIILDSKILFSKDREKIIVKTKEPLEKESSYSIKITTTLTSQNEKTLIKDYRSEFETSPL
jgi:hypothetical protein